MMKLRLFFLFMIIFLFVIRSKVTVDDANDRNSLLVTTEWLAKHLEEPALVVLHIGRKAGYEKRHIPGARLFSVREIMYEPVDGRSTFSESYTI